MWWPLQPLRLHPRLRRTCLPYRMARGYLSRNGPQYIKLVLHPPLSAPYCRGACTWRMSNGSMTTPSFHRNVSSAFRTWPRKHVSAIRCQRRSGGPIANVCCSVRIMQHTLTPSTCITSRHHRLHGICESSTSLVLVERALAEWPSPVPDRASL